MADHDAMLPANCFTFLFPATGGGLRLRLRPCNHGNRQRTLLAAAGAHIGDDDAAGFAGGFGAGCGGCVVAGVEGEACARAGIRVGDARQDFAEHLSHTCRDRRSQRLC